MVDSGIETMFSELMSGIGNPIPAGKVPLVLAAARLHLALTTLVDRNALDARIVSPPPDFGAKAMFRGKLGPFFPGNEHVTPSDTACALGVSYGRLTALREEGYFPFGIVGPARTYAGQLPFRQPWTFAEWLSPHGPQAAAPWVSPRRGTKAGQR